MHYERAMWSYSCPLPHDGAAWRLLHLGLDFQPLELGTGSFCSSSVTRLRDSLRQHQTDSDERLSVVVGRVWASILSAKNTGDGGFVTLPEECAEGKPVSAPGLLSVCSVSSQTASPRPCWGWLFWGRELAFFPGVSSATRGQLPLGKRSATAPQQHSFVAAGSPLLCPAQFLSNPVELLSLKGLRS